MKIAPFIQILVIWPEHLKYSGPSFIQNISQRIGVPDDEGPDDFRGFHRLGLAIAFAHSTPDATLPIFRWEGNGWFPLARRR